VGVFHIQSLLYRADSANHIKLVLISILLSVTGVTLKRDV